MKKNGLRILRQIKSVSFATVRDGKPENRIIDVMMVEDDKLYFLTARGKAFHKQLQDGLSVAISGMTPDYLAVRVKGKITAVGRSWLDRVFEKNPMMNDLYPGEKRDILDPFCLYSGVGETFDLGSHPPQRERFAFGDHQVSLPGYRINDACTACGICLEACPIKAVLLDDDGNYLIEASRCIECGRCFEHCPSNAIDKPGVF